MTGRELLEQLSAMPAESLDLPVLAITCNVPELEGAYPGECPAPLVWMPNPVLLVCSVDAEMSHHWQLVTARRS